MNLFHHGGGRRQLLAGACLPKNKQVPGQATRESWISVGLERNNTRSKITDKCARRRQQTFALFFCSSRYFLQHLQGSSRCDRHTAGTAAKTYSRHSLVISFGFSFKAPVTGVHYETLKYCPRKTGVSKAVSITSHSHFTNGLQHLAVAYPPPHEPA